MSSSLFDRTRMLTKGLFGPKKPKPRLWQKVKTRPTLEVLEDRRLLSATGGGEPMFPAVEVQAGSYVAQQTLSFLSGYGSTVTALRQSAISLGEQALITISRVESSLVLEMQQFIQESLFPSSTANSPSVQPSSPEPGQSAVQNSVGQASGDQPGGTAILPLSAGGISPEDSGGPTGYSPTQIENAYAFNQIGFASYTGSTLPGAGQTITIVDAYNQPNIQGDLQAFDSYYGIAAPPSFNVVNQTGGSTLPADNTSWGTEESLDVEWAHAIAPGANIVLGCVRQ